MVLPTSIRRGWKEGERQRDGEREGEGEGEGRGGGEGEGGAGGEDEAERGSVALQLLLPVERTVVNYMYN